MNKEHYRNDVADRSSWGSGPWDNEPDFFEWDTQVGYPAWAARLDSGAWFVNVIAPYPTDGKMLLAFSHTIRDKYYARDWAGQPGMIAKTEQEGIGEHCISMEHWCHPGPNKDKKRGPYKTLEEVKEYAEKAALYIFDTLQDGSYVDYFKF